MKVAVGDVVRLDAGDGEPFIAKVVRIESGRCSLGVRKLLEGKAGWSRAIFRVTVQGDVAILARGVD